MRIDTFQFTIEDNRAYIIQEAGHAILVDAPSMELVEIIRGKGCVLDYIFLTHEHCDHLWGLNAVRNAFHPCVIATDTASEAIGNYRTNRASVHHIYITMRFGATASRDCTPNPKMICDRAEMEFSGKLHLKWIGHDVTFYSTPGHSKGSGIMLIDQHDLFSGDTMLKGQSVFTMFEGGDLIEYRCITLPILRSFTEGIHVYPGHGDDFLLSEYRLED